MDGVVFFRIDRAHFVHRATDDVEDAAHGSLAHRNHDGLAGIHHLHAAHKTFRGVHGDGAHDAVPKVLRHFADQVRGVAVVGVFDLKRGEDVRQVAAAELHVHDGTDNLDNFTDVFLHVLAPVTR